MAVPEKILELVDKFESNINYYKSLSYNEEDIKMDFINPLFEALGWDVGNKTKPPELREVKFEDSVDVQGRIKNPDYSFRLDRARKFFVEAKKPSVNIEGGLNPAFQLRSYAWSANLPVSIVTDFEEFAVYDCRSEPSKLDKPTKSRLFIIKYYEFEKRWDEIASLFSKESVQKGSLEAIPAPKGKKVDEALLEDISEWREALAVNIEKMNPGLDQKSLNHAVQMTIDRILFLRICEDRSIEDYGRLKKLLDGENVYPRLFELFQEADKRYNSGLFHFHAEEDRNNFDTITESIKIEDGILKDLIQGLYFPDCPYVFSEIPAEILGRVYEQFLGKVIQLNTNHEVQVEDKPEVRKAGGVYYTPSYIVDYIVKNTVGKLLDGKSPKEASELRILDPACGSGSFLIGAYQYLLDWHLDWYKGNLVPLLNAGQKLTSKEVQGLLPAPIEKPGKNARAKSRRIWERASIATLPIEQRAEEWHLRTAERKRILLNNIYGVDIDTQAVEVTKLSLLLKVLEGENKATIADLTRYSDERALPDLGNNIKCGNSLIGWDIQREWPDLTQEELWNINPFDWQKGFSEVFASGGFNAVIGNPPYVEFKRLDEQMKNLLVCEGFRSVSGKYDLYIPFTEKALNLLRSDGFLGFIIPTMFTKRDYGKALRELISQSATPVDIVDFSDFQVFYKVTNYVGIFIFQNGKKNGINCNYRFLSNTLTGPYYIENELKYDVDSNIFCRFIVPAESLGSQPWSLTPTYKNNILDKITKDLKSVKLGNPSVTAAIWEGIASGKDEVFYISETQKRDKGIEDLITLKLLRGRDVKAWLNSPKEDYYVLYPYQTESGKVLSEPEIESTYPNAYKYLVEYKNNLKGRGYFDKSKKQWFELWCPRDPTRFTGEKIVTPEISQRNNFSIDEIGYAFNTKVYGIITASCTRESYLYLLGLLNSKLLDFIYKLNAPRKAGGFYAYKTQFLRELPIHVINFTDLQDVAQHDLMVSFVERMLDLHKQLASTMTEHEKTMLSRQIQATEGQIDSLVYELYGLNEEEIKIVESQAP